MDGQANGHSGSRAQPDGSDSMSALDAAEIEALDTASLHALPLDE